MNKTTPPWKKLEDLWEPYLEAWNEKLQEWGDKKSNTIRTEWHYPLLDPKKLQAEELAKLIDSTLLKPDAKQVEFKTLCEEALEFGFYSVCVPSNQIEFCKSILSGSDTKVITVIGFPHGNSSTLAKKLETKAAIALGAEEIDMVISLGPLVEGRLHEVSEDLQAVVNQAGSVPVKVILETGYLSDAQIIQAATLCKSAGAMMVKTSTGFGPRGANQKDIELMKSVTQDQMGIKASGGIRDLKTLEAMVSQGASRIGTSNGKKIIEEKMNKPTKQNQEGDHGY